MSQLLANKMLSSLCDEYELQIDDKKQEFIDTQFILLCLIHTPEFSKSDVEWLDNFEYKINININNPNKSIQIENLSNIPYNDGLEHHDENLNLITKGSEAQNKNTGYWLWHIPEYAPNKLIYKCTCQGNIFGNINIINGEDLVLQNAPIGYTGSTGSTGPDGIKGDVWNEGYQGKGFNIVKIWNDDGPGLRGSSHVLTGDNANEGDYGIMRGGDLYIVSNNNYHLDVIKDKSLALIGAFQKHIGSSKFNVIVRKEWHSVYEVPIVPTIAFETKINSILRLRSKYNMNFYGNSCYNKSTTSIKL